MSGRIENSIYIFEDPDSPNAFLFKMLVKGQKDALRIDPSSPIFAGKWDEFESALKEVAESGEYVRLAFVRAESEDAGPVKTVGRVVDLQTRYPNTKFAFVGELSDERIKGQLEEFNIIHINPGLGIHQQVETVLTEVFGGEQQT